MTNRVTPNSPRLLADLVWLVPFSLQRVKLHPKNILVILIFVFMNFEFLLFYLPHFFF
jgi:hypothetical protein